MNLRTLAMMVGVSSVLAMAACSSETDDGDGTAGSAGDGGSGADGGAGVGATGGTGGTGSGAEGGTGGGGACISCAAYLTECVVAETPEAYCSDETIDWCDGSDEIYQDLFDCVCASCETECEATCTGAGADGDCTQCGGAAFTDGGACNMNDQGEFATCANDA